MYESRLGLALCMCTVGMGCWSCRIKFEKKIIYYAHIFVQKSYGSFVCVCVWCRMLADRNLPAAIEDSSGDGLPDSLREKAEALQAQGGFKALEEKIFSLPELLQRNQEILEEVGREGEGGGGGGWEGGRGGRGGRWGGRSIKMIK